MLVTLRWQPETKFAFDQVRLPPTETANDFKENQEVEVHSRASDMESFGWWRAIVKVCIFNTVVY